MATLIWTIKQQQKIKLFITRFIWICIVICWNLDSNRSWKKKTQANVVIIRTCSSYKQYYTKIEWRKKYLTVLGITNFSVNNYFISAYSHLWSQSFEMMCKIFAFISFIGKVAVSWPFNFWYALNIGHRTDTPAQPTNGTPRFIFTYCKFLWSPTVRPDDDIFGGCCKEEKKKTMI